MAIPLRDIIDNPKLLDELISSKDKCCYCKTPLSTTLTGKIEISLGMCCSDCYFEKLGEEIEKHPIVNPHRIRR